MTLTLGELTPDFSLPDTDGNEQSPNGGPATVVVFTCNHCPYALAWQDRLADAARDYADRGVRFLAINANMATWLQWVIGSLTLVLAVVWVRVCAEMVARATDVEWTFMGMFGARFMLPHQRERYIERKTRVGVAIPDAVAPVAPKTLI